MKLKNIAYGLIVVATTAIVSCRDYVEVDTYSSRTLRYTADYQYLLNNKSNFETTVLLPLLSSDDVAAHAGDLNVWGNSEYYNAFIWAENYYGDEQTDNNWSNLYKQIYVSNEILDGIMDSENGTQEQKNSIAAETKVHRAFAYLTLANLYAPIYDPANAANQTGLPLPLKVDLFADLSRVSLQKVYDQILDDLLFSVNHLADYPRYNYHPSKIAAYTLLARTYLVMRNFEESAKYADLALALNPKLNDLQTYVGNTSLFPRTLDDPEIILSKKAATSSISTPINTELINLYDAKDLRFRIFLGDSEALQGYRYLRPEFTWQGIDVGLKAPEVILTRAELYAREGNTDKTVELLNRLRIKRFEPADYVPLVDTDIASDPLQAVIDERRREFVGTDMRWFDQRRLNLDPGYTKTITRVYKDVTYTLEPNSRRYVYPIENKVLKYNPEIGQNPR